VQQLDIVAGGGCLLSLGCHVALHRLIGGEQLQQVVVVGVETHRTMWLLSALARHLFKSLLGLLGSVVLLHLQSVVRVTF